MQKMPWESGRGQRHWRVRWDHPLSYGLKFCAVDVNHGDYAGLPLDLITERSAASMTAAAQASWAHDPRHVIVSEITMEAWIWVPNSGLHDYDGIICKEREASPYSGYALMIKSDRRIATYVYYGNFNTQAGFIDGVTGVVPAGQWAQIVGVVSSGRKTVTQYINGQLDTSIVDSDGLNWSGAINNDEPLYLGNSTYSGRVFPGKIGMAKIYNRALTATEVFQSYIDPMGFLKTGRTTRYFIPPPPTFNPAWAARSNVLIQPGVMA